MHAPPSTSQVRHIPPAPQRVPHALKSQMPTVVINLIIVLGMVFPPSQSPIPVPWDHLPKEVTFMQALVLCSALGETQTKATPNLITFPLPQT